MKTQCIIFVLKNDEFFLIENINKLVELQTDYDLYFVTRESKDRTSQILKFNHFVNIELSYDPGYYEALKSGFEFIKNLKYQIWIEFGECGRIELDEIKRLNEINKDYNYEKSVIFASRYIKNKKNKKRKLYIWFLVNIKIADPYTRFKIYNSSSFLLIKNLFHCKIHPQDFLNLLYKQQDFIEVSTKCEKEKFSVTNFSEKFQLFIFSFLILPFIKKFGRYK
ncbi:hypothetical protein ACJA28_03270 [Mesomycoplasma moatsii]|uniref:hypothetical protein n=1 Tax=Mesomycoplasma moatsii TaxID=171287 RepID=UPI0003B5BB41